MSLNSFGNKLRRWKMRRILHRNRIPYAVWHGVTRDIVVLQGLDAMQMAHLRELATWFMHDKSIHGVQGLVVTPAMRVAVAAQACLLILNLDIDYYDQWAEVILYPGAFRVNRDQMDASGVVHHDTSALAGESWLRGPVILSWPDVEHDSFDHSPGHHVLLHEFAHKLDARNGVMNGLPPLRRGMSRKRWAEDLSEGYAALKKSLASARPPCINPYAATNPAEFFAVLSEYFFTAPDVLKKTCPRVYRQLAAFYK